MGNAVNNKRLVHLMLCSHLTSALMSMSPSKFNIASMVMQMQKQKINLYSFSIDTMLNIDGVANPGIKCERVVFTRKSTHRFQRIDVPHFDRAVKTRRCQ